MAIGYGSSGAGPSRPAPKPAATPARVSQLAPASSRSPLPTTGPAPRLPVTGSGGGGSSLLGSLISGAKDVVADVATTAARDVQKVARPPAKAFAATGRTVQKAVWGAANPFTPNAFRQDINRVDKAVFGSGGLRSNISKLRQDLKRSRQGRGY